MFNMGQGLTFFILFDTLFIIGLSIKWTIEAIVRIKEAKYEASTYEDSKPEDS